MLDPPLLAAHFGLYLFSEGMTAREVWPLSEMPSLFF